jgi:hypothetical protein
VNVDAFDNRVTSLGWIAHARMKEDRSPILAVNNQLLVDAVLADEVVALLATKAYQVSARLLTTLLHPDGLARHEYGGKAIEDVLIFELTPKRPALFSPGAQFPRTGIFWLAEEVRGHLRLTAGDLGKISPNHVLIPSGPGFGCPEGPPTPVEVPPPVLTPAGRDPQPITVIDSGWQWDDAWGANPLAAWTRAGVAERLPTADEVGGAVNGAPWQAGTPETPGATLPGTNRLPALAGHANFIAGVIARHCDHAAITVLSHNASFLQNPARRSLTTDPSLDPHCYDFPTEAAVARSLCQAMNLEPGVDPPKVINLGFAFLPWGDPSGGVGTNTVSCVWDRAFRYLKGHDPNVAASDPESVPIVVSPAGNQASALPRYPAALWQEDPKLFDNVVGVGSIDDAAPEPADRAAIVRAEADGYDLATSATFTNYGDWVRCAAVGTNVVSTFLSVDVQPQDQDDPARPHDFSDTGWALWNGTSFAAPKVVAGIGDQLAGGVPDPHDAWEQLKATGATAAALGLQATFTDPDATMFPDLH